MLTELLQQQTIRRIFGVFVGCVVAIMANLTFKSKVGSIALRHGELLLPRG